jgi:two-component system nitrate/nitrite response regulator NarL
VSLKLRRAELAAKPGIALNYGIVIVDRDSMSSQLLADAVRNRSYDASAVVPSELLRTLESRDIGLVIIGADLNPRSASGFDLARSITISYPRVAIVILLDHPTRTSVISAFRVGARGVLSRQQPMSELLDCIEHVSKGFIWSGPTESDFLLEALRHLPAPIVSTAGNSTPLTTRELQVVEKAATGKTNRVIAQDLGLSEHTIKNYLFRAFGKIGVSSRIELLFYLTTQGQVISEVKAERAG